MALTAQQANAILDNITTIDQLKDLINQLDISAGGKVTILYSGNTANGISNSEIIQSMLRNGEDVRVIDKTEAAKFLQINPSSPDYNDAFLHKLEQIVGGNPNVQGSPSNQFLFGGQGVDGSRVANGAWDNVSGRFVDATVGEVRTLTGGASIDRVFGQTELPRALSNVNISSIEGIPLDDLRNIGVDNAFKAISAQSDVFSSQLKVAINNDGSVKYENHLPVIDGDEYFKMTGLQGNSRADVTSEYKHLAEFMPDRMEQHRAGAGLLQDIHAQYERLAGLPGLENAALRASAIKVLDKLGMAGDLLGLGIAIADANEAYSRNDVDGGDKILGDWAVDFTGGWAAGILAARIAGAALLPLYSVGPAGAIVAGVLTFLAGLAGGFFGGQVFSELINAFSHLTGETALAGTLVPRRDPLALDLDGDGIETTSVRDGDVVLFDHDSDGVRTGTGWIKPDDGWLVLDRNGNGVIDSGRELFGVDTIKNNGQFATDGFDALRDYDANIDGKIDSLDSVFASLLVWRDMNQDGISQVNELTSLSANGIVSVGVVSSVVRTDLGNGNLQTAAGIFSRSNGVAGTTGETNSAAANLDLLVSTFYRQFEDRITLTDQAKGLLNIRGAGRVRDLSEAISLSSDLGGLVQAYVQQTARLEQLNQLDVFLEKWADTSDFKSLKAQADSLVESGVKLTYVLSGVDAGLCNAPLVVQSVAPSQPPMRKVLVKTMS